MSATTSTSVMGFISVVDLGGAAWIGGYLLLNSLGRPLEFHCTEPVKANRAQQILFGETLQPYLCGEQIARSLVGNSSLKPAVVLTDVPSVMTLRGFVEFPLFLLLQGSAKPKGSWELLDFGGVQGAVEATQAGDRDRIVQAFEQVASGWDFEEPFERIREAVSELQKAA